MNGPLVAGAALWGAGAGVLLPRPAHRLSVEPDEPWRPADPDGRPFAGPARGWLGAARGYGPSTPVVAALTALVCVGLAATTGARPELGVWLLLAPVAVLLGVVDRGVHRLPDVLTLPLALAATLLLGLAAVLPGHAGAWTTALLGELALGGGYLVLVLINPAGMGLGDAKLALGLGAALGWYGWPVLFAGALLGLVLGAVYGGGLLVLRRANRKAAFPLGPFMIAGAFGGLLLGGLAS
ncbi:prepilin peptidase [Streptomyces sp. WM6378]|uniref:prepilin peptidase n=1 Tax=Streptomyces sp. WM6378 TaxID=1415557 RepID=UPI0006AFEA4B|nr:A24 family peptidase [Streptomyces sp. WM6378]